MLKSLTIFTFYCANLTLTLENNACKHLNDYPTKNSNPHCYYNPDVLSTTPQIIRNHGFEVESHFATTVDGYILQLFRIPPKATDFRKQKQPLYFHHGMMADSSSLIAVGNRSLAFKLATDGYDIWLGNCRGTIYSRGHTFLKTSDEAFWNYTCDDGGRNDISASVQKVADVTGKAGSIVYIGQSKGTIVGFMYSNVHNETNLLRGIIALTPVGYFDPKLQIRLSARLGSVLIPQLQRDGIWTVFPNAANVWKFLRSRCSLAPSDCWLLVTLLAGLNNQLLADDLLHMVSHVPSSFSIKELLHLTQMLTAGRIQYFDYGRQKNLEVYGQEKPPIYDLRKITLPVYLFYGRSDVFVSEEMVLKQFNDLGSTEKGVFKIPIGVDEEESQWGHADFSYGRDIHTHLYPPIKKVLEKKLRPI